MSLGSLDGTRGFARGVWDMLGDRGRWVVPRCGLVYEKCEAERQFALTDRMPWGQGMPFGPDELIEAQQEDHDGIVAMFASINVAVVEATC